MQALQDQLSEALGDLSMARRREEVLKAEVVQTSAKLEDRGAELSKAQVRLFIDTQTMDVDVINCPEVCQGIIMTRPAAKLLN